MAGSTSYPGSVDNKTALQNGVDIIDADDVNDAYVMADAIETFLGTIGTGKSQSWTTDFLEYLSNAAAPVVTKASGSTLSVSSGALLIKNVAQSNRMMRHNSSPVTVSASDLDTGSMADDTFYYVYAVADTAANTFTIKFSVSSSTPTGLSNYELIGWFYNESAGALDVSSGFVGNVRSNGRSAANVVQVVGTTDISTTSQTYVDMTNMEIKFYSNGRPVRIDFNAVIDQLGSFSGDMICNIQILIDGASAVTGYKRDNTNFYLPGYVPLRWIEKALAAGAHTIKIQWKSDLGANDLGVLHQYGSTHAPRVLTVEEL